MVKRLKNGHFAYFEVKEIQLARHYFEIYLHRKERRGRKELVQYVKYFTMIHGPQVDEGISRYDVFSGK